MTCSLCNGTARIPWPEAGMAQDCPACVPKAKAEATAEALKRLEGFRDADLPIPPAGCDVPVKTILPPYEKTITLPGGQSVVVPAYDIQSFSWRSEPIIPQQRIDPIIGPMNTNYFKVLAIRMDVVHFDNPDRTGVVRVTDLSVAGCPVHGFCTGLGGHGVPSTRWAAPGAAEPGYIISQPAFGQGLRIGIASDYLLLSPSMIVTIEFFGRAADDAAYLSRQAA